MILRSLRRCVPECRCSVLVPAGINPVSMRWEKLSPPFPGTDWLFFRGCWLSFEVSGIICRVTQSCLAKMQELTEECVSFCAMHRRQWCTVLYHTCSSFFFFFNWFSGSCVLPTLSWEHDILDSLWKSLIGTKIGCMQGINFPRLRQRLWASLPAFSLWYFASKTLT